MRYNARNLAKKLAKRGYYCFPSWGYCHSDCFKRPRTIGGFYDNTLRSDHYFDCHPSFDMADTALGIWCGTFLAVDLDGEEGTEQYIQMMKEMGIDFDIEMDYTVKTPSNGYHIYYRAPVFHSLIKSVSRYGGMKIDLRTCRGYVVCPGMMKYVDLLTHTLKPYTVNKRFLDDEGLLIPAYQLPICPEPLQRDLWRFATDKSTKHGYEGTITERQLELLSYLQTPYRYIYDYLQGDDVAYGVIREPHKRVPFLFEVRNPISRGFKFAPKKLTENKTVINNVTQSNREEVRTKPNVRKIMLPPIDMTPADYLPTLEEMNRIVKYAKTIPNSKDRDENGRQVEGHKKTLKVISFIYRTIANGNARKARAIIDKWNESLNWTWDDLDIERKMFYIIKNEQIKKQTIQ